MLYKAYYYYNYYIYYYNNIINIIVYYYYYYAQIFLRLIDFVISHLTKNSKEQIPLFRNDFFIVKLIKNKNLNE